MIQGVIFDLGHTIWDIEPGDAAELEAAYADMRAKLCASLGRDDLPDARALRIAVSEALGADADTYFTSGPVLEQPPTHHWVGNGCRALGLELDEDLLRSVTGPLFATEVGRLVVLDGTVETIHDLHAAGFALGVVTNTLADEGTIRLMLRNHGIENLMTSVVVSSEEGHRKPHPSLFEKAARELGVDPANTLFVGDSPYHDIGGATAVGMRAVLTTQYIQRPWIEGVPEPYARITHLRELVHIAADG